jgi:hypothetical protein
VWEGSISDSNSAIVYMQQPESMNELDFKNSIPEGDIIDVRIMQNPSEELLRNNQPGSKKLMGEDGIIDSNEMPTDKVVPLPKKEIPDSLKKKKIVPGMNVHTVPIIDPKQKNNSKDKNTNSSSSSVIGADKKPKPKPKPKPKTDTKQAPVKNNENTISNEFN